jgi:phosphoglycolate phosphatase-like HAD superfamily hydrolase
MVGVVTGPCVVFDIDGVLADVGHRLHYLTKRPKDWDGFFAAASADPVLEVGAAFARQVVATHEVVYLTGRPARLRAATQAWLGVHHLPPGTLIMRGDADRRPGVTIKLHELRRLHRTSPVDLFIDDDPAVIAAARDAGFGVRLADWMATPSRPASRHAVTDRDATLFDDVLHQAQQTDGRT